MSRADDLSADLAADLMQDMAEQRAVAERAVEPSRPAGAGAAPAGGDEPAPFAEAAFFLAPSTWQLPRLTRTGRSVTIGAGPLRVRIGR